MLMWIIKLIKLQLKVNINYHLWMVKFLKTQKGQVTSKVIKMTNIYNLKIMKVQLIDHVYHHSITVEMV